jgi:hypothetical protein
MERPRYHADGPRMSGTTTRAGPNDLNLQPASRYWYRHNKLSKDPPVLLDVKPTGTKKKEGPELLDLVGCAPVAPDLGRTEPGSSFTGVHERHAPPTYIVFGCHRFTEIVGTSAASKSYGENSQNNLHHRALYSNPGGAPMLVVRRYRRHGQIRCARERFVLFQG